MEGGEAEKISSLTGIGIDELSELQVTSFADLTFVADGEVEGLPLRQQQKLKAVRDCLIAGNEIAADVTMLQIASTQARRVRRRVGEFLGPAEIDDSSERLLQGLRNRMVGSTQIQTFPSAEACRAMLFAHPLEIRVTQEMCDYFRERLTTESINLNAFQNNAHVSFRVTPNESEVPTGLLKFLASFDLDSISWTGETEDEIHAFVETALTGPVYKFCKPTFRISRNKSLKTSSGRADYSISSGYNQILRGEDKMRPRVAQEDPKVELVKKSPKGQQWTLLYGPDVPYIFGYYSIGGTDNLLLQFVCIQRDSSELISLTATPFDLTKFSGVFGCRCFMLALIPHLLSLKDAITAPIGLEWKVQRTERRDGLWEFWEAHIVLDQEHQDCALAKDFYYEHSLTESVTERVRKWERMYALLPESRHLMKLRRISNSVSTSDTEAGRVRCVFEPLCQPHAVSSSFDNEISARLAVSHIANGLAALHDRALVHNDVRWTNVVRKQGEEVYVLVDYDEMEELDTNGNVPAIVWMDPDTHAPDISQSHSQKVDVWGLCKMITELKCTSGNVDDLVAAAAKWLGAYPDIPGDILAQVEVLCTL